MAEGKPSGSDVPEARRAAGKVERMTHALRRRSWPGALRLWIIAGVVGLCVGGAVIVFRLAIAGGEFFFYSARHETLATAAASLRFTGVFSRMTAITAIRKAISAIASGWLSLRGQLSRGLT